METGLVETKIQDRLRPHTDNIRNGTFNEHDILPALFDLILRNQKALTDLTEKKLSESKFLAESILSGLDASDAKTLDGQSSIKDLISNSHADLKGYIQVVGEQAISKNLDYHNAVMDNLRKQRTLGLITLIISCLSLITAVAVVAILTLR
jgi:hypothetical protein